MKSEAEKLYERACECDRAGRERDAIGFYERAIAAGLSGESLAGAYLGLGSSLRALGEYARAVEVLERGHEIFPDDKALEVFLAMAHYNAKRPKEALERLLRLLAETTADADIAGFKRAILLYAEDIERVWD